MSYHLHNCMTCRRVTPIQRVMLAERAGILQSRMSDCYAVLRRFLTGSRLLATQNLTAQNLTAQSPMAQNLTAQSPMAQNLTAQNLTAQNPMAQSFAAQSPMAQSLTAQSLVACQPTAAGVRGAMAPGLFLAALCGAALS